MKTDKPLKDLTTEDLTILASSLHEAIQDMRLVGLDKSAEELNKLRAKLMDELTKRNSKGE